MVEQPGFGTRCVHAGDDPGRYFGAVSPPIFEASLFAFDDFDACLEGLTGGGDYYIYTRGRNPTVEIAEHKLAALEGGEAAKFFASGMAAISAVVLSHVKQGDHVLCVRSVYGVTHTLLTQWLPRFGVSASFVDGTDLAAIEASIQDNTRLIYLESPTSVLFQLQDLAAVARIAKQRGILTAVDNSWASPIFQQPLALGIDLSIHTASKYIGGHSDLVAGAVIGRKELIDRLRNNEYAILGGVIGPFEAWLCIRGMRTLPLRLKQHEASGLEIASWLENHPKVRRVMHPGLASHPQHELARRQMSGMGGLFSFELDADLDGIRRFVNALSLFHIGVSWGGFESLVLPIGAVDAHKSQKTGTPGQEGLPLGLIRLFIGLEDAQDLRRDLEQALERV